MFRRLLSTIALTSLLATVASGAAAGVPCPRIELSEIVAAEAPGARRVSGPDGEVLVTGTALLTSADLLSAGVSEAEGDTGLDLNPTSAAGERLRAYTTANVGRQVAFLVDDRAVKVVKILDPMLADGLWISPMAPDEAGRLAAEINACKRN
jgi:preprotein translocase subunit SecD